VGGRVLLSGGVRVQGRTRGVPKWGSDKLTRKGGGKIRLVGTFSDAPIISGGMSPEVISRDNHLDY